MKGDSHLDLYQWKPKNESWHIYPIGQSDYNLSRNALKSLKSYHLQFLDTNSSTESIFWALTGYSISMLIQTFIFETAVFWVCTTNFMYAVFYQVMLNTSTAIIESLIGHILTTSVSKNRLDICNF